MSFSKILFTTSSKEEAELIAHKLLHHRLVACVNVSSPIDSHFVWKDKLQHTQEWNVSAKTQTKLVELAMTKVRENHSYDCPCIYSQKIESIDAEFAKWICSETERESRQNEY